MHEAQTIKNGRIERFADFADEPEPLEGTKMKLDNIINKEIVITGHDLKTSRYTKNRSGKYLTLQFMLSNAENNDPHIVFTGSDVLIDQIERYSDHVPFIAIIKKINRYYTLS